MKTKKMIHFGRFIRHISVILLLFGAFNLLLLDTQHASAQTGAPPPPSEPVFLPPVGSLVIDPIFPAIPPANIAPLVGNGALAVIPQNTENGIGLINALFSNETRTTLLVPASNTTDLIGKIQEFETSNLPAAALPVAFTTALKVFEISIFDAQTGELITTHNPPLQIGIELSPGVSPEDVALLHFSASKGEYEEIKLTGDPIKGIVKAEITETSPFPFVLISTAVSPDLAKADNDDNNEVVSSQGETIAEVLATPTLSQVDTIDSASAQLISAQEEDGTASRTLFGSAPESNDGSKSLFGSPADDESKDESENTSEDEPSESASVTSESASTENKSSNNNSPLLSGFAVLITSLGAGFGLFRSRFN